MMINFERDVIESVRHRGIDKTIQDLHYAIIYIEASIETWGDDSNTLVLTLLKNTLIELRRCQRITREL